MGTEYMEPSCVAVPNLRIDWNFSTHQWDAKFVHGPRKGVHQSMSPADVTDEGWANLQAKALVGDIDLRDASKSLKRLGAKKLLIEWCVAIAGGYRQDFEAKCALQPAVAAEDSAVAAARSVTGQ